MSGTEEFGGVRVAIEGCGHGTLKAIYQSAQTAAEKKGWSGLDLLIIGGDFQAVRNAADLNVMSVPAVYRQLGDFPAYYSGQVRAAIPTIFIGGNHEASSHLWELYYGGWVAPNMYYLGAANVLRFGPLRIAGMSGIWKGYNYKRTHHERLPFNGDDIKSFYHVREMDVRKLLLLRDQVDVGLSHDWPRAIERHGDMKSLWRKKPDFQQESDDGTLGNLAAALVLDRLRPAYWFSAHLHCKYSAIKTFTAPAETCAPPDPAQLASRQQGVVEPPAEAANPDEIDIDTDDDDEEVSNERPGCPDENGRPIEQGKTQTTGLGEGEKSVATDNARASGSAVPDELRKLLPASFNPVSAPPRSFGTTSGQPVPPTIRNTETRFLALDKCLPGRHYLQVCEIVPVAPKPGAESITPDDGPFRLQYDPEWLAITRVFHQYLTIGDRQAQNPPDLGEEAYRPMIDEARAWVEEKIVQPGKLDVPDNFAITATPIDETSPDRVREQPDEYTNPQTAAFCQLLGLDNLWDASPEERAERKAQGPPPEQPRQDGHKSGRGRSGGRGGQGRGRGRGRGRSGPAGRGRGRGGHH